MSPSLGKWNQNFMKKIHGDKESPKDIKGDNTNFEIAME